MQHREFEVLSLTKDLRRPHAVRWRVEELAVRNEGGVLGEPGWIPKRPDFTFCLVACARSAVEAFIRWSLQEKKSASDALTPPRE